MRFRGPSEAIEIAPAVFRITLFDVAVERGDVNTMLELMFSCGAFVCGRHVAIALLL
jgi:hypothetical protein